MLRQSAGARRHGLQRAVGEKSQKLQFSKKMTQRISKERAFERTLTWPRPPQWGVERGPGWPAGMVLGKYGQIKFGTTLISLTSLTISLIHCSDMFQLFRVPGCFWPCIGRWNPEKSQRARVAGVFWARPDERSSKRLVRHSEMDGT